MKTNKETIADFKFPTEILKKGSEGAEVKKWQKYLNILGYGLTVDGDFGKLTETATKDFQKRTGLKADGIVGTKTVAKAKTTKKLPKQQTKTANEKCIDGVIAFAKKYEADNSYKYKKWTKDVDTHKCPICHPDSGKGWNCIGFVSACFYHGGGVKTVRCNNAGLGNNTWFDTVTADKWREHNGQDWLQVKTPKRGDVIICYSKGKYVHTALYIGNGYIIDATSLRGIKKRKYSELSKYSKKLFRYTGKGKY